jgi:hypothetical protein
MDGLVEVALWGGILLPGRRLFRVRHNNNRREASSVGYCESGEGHTVVRLYLRVQVS